MLDKKKETADILRKFFAQFNDLRPATRARKQASVAGFFKVGSAPRTD